jgi:hypothetical protein
MKIVKIVAFSLLTLFGAASLMNGLAAISDPKLGSPISILPGIFFVTIGVILIRAAIKEKN